MSDYVVTTPPDRIERLERRIAETLMTAALDADWEQLHLRSRAFTEQFTHVQEPARQVDMARQIRLTLWQAGDAPGLRALRLATAAPLAGWLQDPSTRAVARAFSRDMVADQRAALPEFARLEDQLALARGQSE